MTAAQRRALDIALHEKLISIEDKLALVETMVMSLMMVSSWQVMWDYLYIAGFGKTDELGLYFAIFLLVLELFLFFNYLRNTRAMITSDASPPAATSNCPWIGKFRMRFVGKRFAPHASYWQFIV